MNFFQSLKFTTPLALVFFVMTAVVMIKYADLYFDKRRLIDNANEKSLELSYKMTHDVEVMFRFSQNPRDFNDLLMNYLISDVNFIAVYTNGHQLYKSYYNTPVPDRDSFVEKYQEEVIKQNSVVTKLNPELNMLQIIARYTLPKRLDEIVSSNFGVVYFEYSLERDLAILYERSEQSFYINLMWGVLLLILMNLFMVVKFIHPLSQLSKATKKVTEGDYVNISLEYKSYLNDEIRTLFNSFKEMSLKIKEKKEALEKANINLMEQTHKALQANQAIDSVLIVSKTDTKGIITYANDKFEKISGYSHDELLGHSHRIIRHPDTPRETFKDLWDTIQSGKIWYGDLANRAKDGSTYYVKSSIIPLKDASGKILEYLGVREDITELVNARIKAEKAEAAQARFLANMSHEIRTPMNGIIGFGELLANSDLDNTQRKYIEIINSSTSTLLHTINGILDFSKIIDESLILEKIETDLSKELTNVYELLKSVAYKKALTYTVAIDKDMLPCLYADPTRFKQVITNLLSNAIKFTPEHGHVNLKTKVLSTTHQSQKIRFSVVDSGIGISKTNQEKIFKAFSQADETTTREFGGTGLGLSISKSIVESFGGELKVESEEGKGSVFYFELELEICSSAKTSSAPDTIRLDDTSEEIKEEQKLKILVAEDYEVNQTLIEAIFSGYDIDLDFASNGKEAVEKVQDNTYDLVLMDINMPVMNGIEATLIIRKEVSDTLPIIALTANAIEGDKERFIANGMNDYLSKPININQLDDLIKKYSSLSLVKKSSASQTEENTSTAFNYTATVKAIKTATGVDDAAALRLLRSLDNSIDGSLEALRLAIEKKDYDIITQIAHKLQGATGTLKLDLVYMITTQMERDASEKKERDYNKDLQRMKDFFNLLRKELRDVS